jgi:hypothetical protein
VRPPSIRVPYFESHPIPSAQLLPERLLDGHSDPVVNELFTILNLSLMNSATIVTRSTRRDEFEALNQQTIHAAPPAPRIAGAGGAQSIAALPVAPVQRTSHDNPCVIGLGSFRPAFMDISPIALTGVTDYRRQKVGVSCLIGGHRRQWDSVGVLVETSTTPIS